MNVSGGIQASLPGRYATALFDLARDSNAIDQVSGSIATLRSALAESAELRFLAASPMLARRDAARAIDAVAAELDLDRTTRNFLGVLAQNGRLSQLGPVIRIWGQLAAAHRNETVAEVTSAYPLGEDQVEALRAQLRQRFRREIAVDLHVDKALLGGLVVKVGSQQIDGSIRTKLNSLAHAMKG